MGLLLLIVLIVLLMGGLPTWGLQPKLGLRPQRWLGSRACGRAGTLAHGVHSPWFLTEYGFEKEYAEDR